MSERPAAIERDIHVVISGSAQRHIRFSFNPSNLDEVAEIKTLSGALITRLEGLMHKTIERDELAQDAIKLVRAASMAAVLAATAEVPKKE
jgi:hypothetical protein